ncbi:hypothetical protein THAOC_06924 [Thalassiosira oceanica]|uniref:FAD/NAD(P)-binding domain-containing protein n=1 Tax=Thalassiosira oceanica TaxID=159749 RepID=K0T1J9_THAOC|nr:hypothetical protein THAOC_06924 [Thalassiosira oceanica]|eukprot:EJK71615.1 hypothetical protein THAOC_06924 [Thalassiosira oceanica]
MKLAIASLCVGSTTAFSSFMGQNVAHAPATSSSALSMKYKVAVVGGGPSGACAAEIFAQEKNIDTVLFERKMDNAKPCGGAIPLCMIGEFDIPETTVDRKVSTSPSVSESRWCIKGGGGEMIRQGGDDRRAAHSRRGPSWKVQFEAARIGQLGNSFLQRA